MRICLILPSAPPETIGGAELQSLSLAEKIRSMGHQVACVVGSGIKREKNKETTYIPCSPRLLFPLHLLLSLFKLHRDDKLDIVHLPLWGWRTLPAAMIFSRFTNVPVVLRIPRDEHLKYHDSLLFRPMFELSRKCDKIVVLNRKTIGEMLDFGFKKNQIEFIPNGVNLKKFKFDAKLISERIKNIKSKKFTIGFIGRLVPEKGIVYLRDAFNNIHKQYPDSKLLVVGEGPQKSLLYTADGVEMTGKLQDIRGELNKMDILVLPSISEGFSNVMLEAMSSGVPVVATSVGAAEDVIKTGINGFLVDPGVVSSLSMMLAAIIAKPECLRSVIKNARLVAEKYDIDPVSQVYERFYQKLIGTVR